VEITFVNHQLRAVLILVFLVGKIVIVDPCVEMKNVISLKIVPHVLETVELAPCVEILFVKRTKLVKLVLLTADDAKFVGINDVNLMKIVTLVLLTVEPAQPELFRDVLLMQSMANLSSMPQHNFISTEKPWDLCKLILMVGSCIWQFRSPSQSSN